MAVEIKDAMGKYNLINSPKATYHGMFFQSKGAYRVLGKIL